MSVKATFYLVCDLCKKPLESSEAGNPQYPRMHGARNGWKKIPGEKPSESVEFMDDCCPECFAKPGTAELIQARIDADIEFSKNIAAELEAKTA